MTWIDDQKLRPALETAAKAYGLEQPTTTCCCCGDELIYNALITDFYWFTDESFTYELGPDLVCLDCLLDAEGIPEEDIPEDPKKTYGDEWKGWQAFLGDQWKGWRDFLGVPEDSPICDECGNHPCDCP